jgi:hypothetical protein
MTPGRNEYVCRSRCHGGVEQAALALLAAGLDERGFPICTVDPVGRAGEADTLTRRKRPGAAIARAAFTGSVPAG